LENSGEDWQQYFDLYVDDLPEVTDYFDGLVGSPFAAWEIFWRN
jgi:hypothetical protein